MGMERNYGILMIIMMANGKMDRDLLMGLIVSSMEIYMKVNGIIHK